MGLHEGGGGGQMLCRCRCQQTVAGGCDVRESTAHVHRGGEEKATCADGAGRG